ncbi:MAG: FMN-binding protein [Proteobacteria bacterium]|nr:FMN-binding protein [Pseudomonadota bacterium]MDA1064421.1 FMN-binding protein [Pseudomonadota bacterium]
MTGRFKKNLRRIVYAVLLTSAAAIAAGEVGRYQTRAEFLLESFGTENPASDVVWIDDELRATAAKVLGHPPAMLRVRYWHEGPRTAWIIDEVGKEQPITFGVVVEDAAIQVLRVMQFRESRGWEIRYPFFTKQFSQLRLTDSGSLSHGIDAISGATLSVKAATGSANLALVLDEYTRRTRRSADITQ